MYVIKKGGMFVSGNTNQTKNSYTRNLAFARLYKSESAAIADLCPGNEHVEPLDCQYIGGKK
jgi:hypothetical protein